MRDREKPMFLLHPCNRRERKAKAVFASIASSDRAVCEPVHAITASFTTQTASFTTQNANKT